MNRLVTLHDTYGQSPWLDNLKRGYLTSGQLADLVERGIRGLTSNPTIFQKAIQGSPDYDAQFRELAAARGTTLDTYWSLVLHDIKGALDVFAPLYDKSHGQDGFVSVEVAPDLAHDSARTLAAARALHERIARPNVMIKIPATAEGVPAVRGMIAEGRSVNATLIFDLDRYQAVMEAYLDGLEAYAKTPGADLAKVASVASFFISRVDTEVDRRLDQNGSDAALALRGKVAVAQAKLAYRAFEQTFSGARWDRLADRGARVQRPLWASTSTKNPAYPDTLYVDTLIGPHTVNTLPDSTLEAFADHGRLARTIDDGVAEAEALWAALPGLGIDMAEVGAQLEREGVSSFQKSFDELVTALDHKAKEF